MKEAFKKDLLKLAIEMLKVNGKEVTAENVIIIYRQLVFAINTPTRFQ